MFFQVLFFECSFIIFIGKYFLNFQYSQLIQNARF